MIIEYRTPLIDLLAYFTCCHPDKQKGLAFPVVTAALAGLDVVPS